jgi:hypothetical protein
VICAEVIPLDTAEPFQFLTHHTHRSGNGCRNAGEQAQQGALPASARTLDEQAFARGHLKGVDG